MQKEEKYMDKNTGRILIKITAELRNVKMVRFFNMFNQLHRTDGPAVIWPNGKEEWYYNGKKITLGADDIIRLVYRKANLKEMLKGKNN